MFKKDKNNFDFISQQFENDKISLPDSLTEKAVRERLEDKEPVRIKFTESKTFKRAVSLVACAAVIITSLSVSFPFIKESRQSKTIDNTDQTQAVATFSSYDEIKSTVKDLNNRGFFEYYFDGVKSETAYDMSEIAVTEGGAGASSYARTYKQVDAVDEADIIKNDGKYIYYLCDSGALNIYSANGKNTELISSISDFRYDVNGKTDDEFISDIYVKDNKLILNVNKSVMKSDYWRSYSVVYIYDITNIKKPEQINKFEQSGYYISSRMIGNQLYVISNFSVNDYRCKNEENYIPYTCDGKSEGEPIKAQNICVVDEPDRAGYLVVSAIDVESGKRSTESKAVFGAGEEVYCNENNMYVISSKWIEQDIIADTDEEIAPVRRSDSQIIKISLSDKIEFKSSCKVKGEINNQFSLDEKDGFLRVATTSVNEKGNDVNNLFVLDEDLKQVGKVTGFAKDESIQSVRFVGDTAYVITYEEIDPLFVIDLSNPENPQIKGSVEITGFSSLLVPVDENTLLGIGYGTKENDYGEQTTSGLKLALFDISDAENPKVLDSKVIENAYSQAQDNHKALVVNPQKEYYAFVYDINYYDKDTEIAKNGALTFRVDNGKIKITNNFVENYEGYSYYRRCTYVDDYLYAVSDGENVNITAYEIK